MKHVFKSTLVTLMFTLALMSAFGQDSIKILDSNPNNHSLTLSDKGVTTVGWLKRIRWVIRDSKVESFKLKRKSKHNIFTSTPEQNFGTTMNLRSSIFLSRDWDYSIIWIDVATHTEHTFDPKIAIKPSSLTLLLLFVVLITSISSIVFYRKRRVANRTVQKADKIHS